MQTPMTVQIAEIIQQTEKFTKAEKQNLFWVMFEKFGQEDLFQYYPVNWDKNAFYVKIPQDNFDWENFGDELMKNRTENNKMMIDKVKNLSI